MSTPTDKPAATPAAPKKGSKLRLLIIAVVVLAGAGGGAWWFMRPPVAAAAHGEEAKKPAEEHAAGSLLPLETFTVNLADPGVSRFLRVTIQLVLSGETTAAEVEHDPLALTRIRSSVLELLTTQRSDTLVTAEGKTALKKAIADQVAATVDHEVTDVLFSDFVVQF